MTLAEAIEILTHMSKSTNVSSLEDCVKAIKLGIEALKYRKHLKDEGIIMPGFLLPGETE